MKILIIWATLFLISVQCSFGQVEIIRKLKQTLPQVRDSIQYVDVLNKISLLFYEQNADSSLYYSRIARDIAYRLDYAKGIADATNNLGIVYDIKGNTQLALRYYNDACNQYKLLKDSSNIVQTLMNIAMVYSVSGKDQKAISNFRQALSLGNRIANDSITALAIYNYMLLYPGEFKGEVKTKNISQASAIAFKYKDLRMQLAIEQLQANDYISSNQREKGIKLLQETLARSLQMELFFFSMDLMIQLGDLHLTTDPDIAIAYYEQALEITERKGYRVYAKVIGEKLYDYYESKNDTSKAYVYSQELMRLFEEQADIDKKSGIDYIEYAVKDQELKSERVKSLYNSRLLWLAIVVCVLTILSIVFLWRNWLLTKKTNSVLQMQFRQLETTTEALELSNQNYAKVIKIVAHDLRNPIGAINGISTLLQEDDLTVEERKEFVQLIHDSSNSCITLIGDLLSTDFHFKESELRKEGINLGPFLQQVVTLLTFRASEKNQQLILKDRGPSEILADRDKLLRVINNLVVNAIKFSPEGENIEVSTEQISEGVIIAVKDNGLGIPIEAAGKIFDPFTTSKRTGTAGEQPFGLGLYISKQIVEAHQGKIWFESEAGKGTSFFVFIPVDSTSKHYQNHLPLASANG
ncbi:tetratricopeptide repeat-containing sensor histidine kinase [Dyadobacter sp. CY323]|uniref:ATP-binding protein n=1 Tax=Dyadobacter sp. CY323 TaxID=2907302 RepID=UPI001F16F6A7|nr:tetratricopeptide repeat-containing sensor histidine kinase [Dyadobacter sp. CY323]MCE6993033.1 tetratricopeptide repeat-containing sensor histidine kinase [Dyadobacter sp. CY323]